MNRKKRILQIGPSYKLCKGGMATVLQQIRMSSIINKNFDVDFYESYIDSNKLSRVIFSIRAWLSFLFKINLYDIYHIHMASNGSFYRKAFYILIISLKKRKIIIHIHGGGFLEFYTNSSHKKFIRYILSKANLILVLSENIRNDFVDRLHLDNVHVLKNGIETYLSLTNYEFNKDININNFCFFGKICKDKGVFDLIESINLAKRFNPNIKIYICGVGESEKMIELINANNLQDNCSYLGWVDSEEKRSVFMKCSTLILPSYSEALPMCILEAMSYGLAIISTNIGAIPELVCNENGILITPGDVNALAEAITLLSQNEDLVKNLCINNIRKINDEFCIDKIHNKLMNYYNCL